MKKITTTQRYNIKKKLNRYNNQTMNDLYINTMNVQTNNNKKLFKKTKQIKKKHHELFVYQHHECLNQQQQKTY